MSKLSLLLAENTLGHQLARPLFQKANIAQMPVSLAAKRIQAAYDGELGLMQTQAVQPEHGALTFYGMNHGVALIMQARGLHEPLPDDEFHFVKSYVDHWSVEGVRAFYYLICIITREFRHGSKHSSAKWKKFGPEMDKFMTGLKGKGEVHLFQSPPDTTLENYCKAIEWGFTGHGFGGSFGGKPWQNIATCVRKFVSGEYSMEVMLDTIWTLSHNTGPIFNKGMFYHTQNNSALLRILDVQRSGQIPQMVLSDQNVSQYVSKLPQLKNDMEWLVNRFKLETQIDWQSVVDLGAVGTYSKELSGQKATGFKPKTPPKKESTTGDFFIMPGLSVKTFKPKRSEAA